MSGNHFIDTNIVIGYTVDWDRHQSKISSYVSSCKSACIYASGRVLTEAEDVVNERRRLASQAANRVFRDFSGTPPISIDDVINFTRRELGDHRDSVVDHVLQYIKSEPILYKNLVETSTQNALQLTIKDINSDFKQAIDVIDDLRLANDNDLNVELFTGELKSYNGKYSCFSRLDSIFSGSPVDRDILLDAHHLTRTSGPASLDFVTMDFHHMHDNKSQIESLLSDLSIKKPSSY